MEQNTALANRLKSLCEEKGISYADLAQKSGIPVRRIQRMAFGATSNPTVFMMLRICDALGITLDEFFGTDEFKDFRA